MLVLPQKYRQRLKSTNLLERLIAEVRRREPVIRIFPNERSAWRLLGTLLAEQHEVWSTGRRWLNMARLLGMESDSEAPAGRMRKVNQPADAKLHNISDLIGISASISTSCRSTITTSSGCGYGNSRVLPATGINVGFGPLPYRGLL